MLFLEKGKLPYMEKHMAIGIMVYRVNSKENDKVLYMEIGKGIYRETYKEIDIQL
jgi:hypothetical protein